MKRFIVLAFALLTLSARLPAQSNAISGNLNAATTTCLVSNSCLVLTVPTGAGGATIKLSGTFSATVQFEASADLLSTALADANWVALLATPSNSSTAASSATSTGVWQVNVSGYTRIRIRVSTYASGTVAGAINTSTASARGGAGGGGGGGAVASCTTAGGVAYENGTANTLTCDGNFIWDKNNIDLVTGPPSSTFSAYAQTTLSTPPEGQITTQMNSASGREYGIFSFAESLLALDHRAAGVFDMTVSNSGTLSGSVLEGGNGIVDFHGSAGSDSTTNLYGWASEADVSSAQTVNKLSAFHGFVDTEISGSTMTNATVYDAQMSNIAGGTMTNAFFYKAFPMVNAGTVGSLYDYYASAQSAGSTNNYGLYTEDFGAGANNYSIYSVGGKVFLGGTMQVGQGTAGTPGYGFASANGGFYWNGAVCETIAGTPSWCSLDTHAIQAANTNVYAFCPGNPDTPSANCLTGISQDSNGVIDVGNGTQGNTSGTVQATKFAAISDGVHNGEVSLLCQTTNATLPANTVSLLGCTAASNTAWGITLPTAENGSAGILHLGAASSHYSAATVSAVSLSADVTGTLPNASVGAAPLPTPGSTCTFAAPRTYCICTTTCTITVPVPAAGYEFCALNSDNVATVITMSAIGSSARYENTARTAYGTAGTGTFVSGGAVGDKACLLGLDATHYLTVSYQGAWTAN